MQLLHLKKHIVFLFVIVCIAFFLRLYKVNVNPPSLSWDEVSIGYNAYSVLKTGRDEHGKFLPLDTFVSYGDYKPPLAIYLTVPFVAIFGLNELSVRLPSALFGTLTVIFTYFLVKELFVNRQKANSREQITKNEELTKNQELRTRNLPLLSALLLAISPWHINLSRAGFEANIALFFVVLGVYLVFRAIRNQKIWFYAFLPFVVAMYTFNSSRYFVPMLGMGVVVIFWKSIKDQWRYIAAGCVIAILTLLPIIPHLFSKEARLRFTEVNIFSDSSVVVTSNRRIEEAGNAWWAKIIYNRRVGYARSFLIHYLDHFGADYLFIKGDGNPKFSIQSVGQLYLIEAPFLVIGVFALLKASPAVGLFLLYWLCMAIVPAAVARETPHALRTLNSLPTWQIFIAVGILTAMSKVKSLKSQVGMQNTRSNKYDFKDFTDFKNFRLLVFCFLLTVLYFCNVSYYLFNYSIHYPWMYSGEWQYGYREALQFVSPIAKNYDTIYMTENIGRPYMYTLFYEKVDPDVFLKTKDDGFDAAGFYHVYGLGKYRFVKDMPSDCTGKCLFIAPAGVSPKDSRVLKTIPLLNGIPILTIYEN